MRQCAGGERKVQEALRNIHGELFIDLGANLGFYPNLLKGNFQRILAVEADPFIFNQLKRSLPSNAVALNVAIADTEGSLSFYLDHSSVNYGMGSLIPNWQVEYDSQLRKQTVTVQATTLNSLLKDEKVVELVKVDVEGAEWAVLSGAEKVMNKIKCMVIELHNPKRKDELANRMGKYGYKCKWLDANHLLCLK